MPYVSLNPSVNKVMHTYPSWDSHRLALAGKSSRCTDSWAQASFTHRAEILRDAAIHLRVHRDQYATLITQEMGKLLRESRAEVEKCAGLRLLRGYAESF